MFFFKNHEENEAGTLVQDFFLFFEKTLYEIKGGGLQLNLIYFDCSQLGIQLNKNCKTLVY